MSYLVGRVFFNIGIGNFVMMVGCVFFNIGIGLIAMTIGATANFIINIVFYGGGMSIMALLLILRYCWRLQPLHPHHGRKETAEQRCHKLDWLNGWLHWSWLHWSWLNGWLHWSWLH